MDRERLLSLNKFPLSARQILKKGNFTTVWDLLLSSSQDISRRCKIKPYDARKLLEAACEIESSGIQLRSLPDAEKEDANICTTGDTFLDVALGGGIKTGMIWEIFGESAAGKTQLALQLSLCIQLPRSMGGLEGSACYLTTSSTLPTARLHQISRTRGIFSGDVCGLAHVHTISTPTISVLINVLMNILPSFISSQASNPSMKPVRILVIDALAELFHSSSQTSSSTLFERSKNISEISLLLHNIATVYHIAVIVLNEVVDAFNHANNSEAMEGHDYLVYNDQSKWFNKADSVPGENLKEASLGLTWSNQINTRILLSRTGRRRHLTDNELTPRKRLRIDDQHTEEQSKEADELDNEPALIRRLSVIFSSISEPISMDYIVSEQGITCLSGTSDHPHQHSSVLGPSTLPPVDICETPSTDPFSSTTAAPIEEEWDKLSFDEGAYDDFDWDALEQQLTQIPA